MRKSFLLLLPVFILCACNPPKEPAARDILNNIIKQCASHNAVSYYIKYGMHLSGSNNYTYSGHVTLIKAPKDSLFHGIMWFAIHTGDIDEKYYDGHNIYLVSDSLKKYRIFTLNNNAEAAWRNGVSPDHGVYPYFFNDAPLIEMLNDTSIKESLAVDKIGYKDYWKVTCSFPDMNYIRNRTAVLWVDRKDTIIKKIVFQLNNNTNEAQTEEADIDSVRFDKDTPESLGDLMKRKLSSLKLSADTPQVIIPTSM